MFTTEFEAEVDESESATLQQYYREAMIQGYNFAFEVKWQWININELLFSEVFIIIYLWKCLQLVFFSEILVARTMPVLCFMCNDIMIINNLKQYSFTSCTCLALCNNILFFINLTNRDVPIPVLAIGTLLIHVKYMPIPWHRYQLYTCAYVNNCVCSAMKLDSQWQWQSRHVLWKNILRTVAQIIEHLGVK